MKADKNKLPSQKSNPINVFGCTKCSVLYVHYDDVTEMNCAGCDTKIDVFCTYKYLAFSGELLKQIPGADRIQIHE